ncbi:MAG: twin-arginine translocation signal domain-containing protein [SAR324 cluster bacterium]|nr:twin-arginine translocation signal domain-containing protein [SAR324 cluster bacterium]
MTQAGSTVQVRASSIKVKLCSTIRSRRNFIKTIQAALVICAATAVVSKLFISSCHHTD